MESPNLELVSPENLVAKLNSILSDPEDKISLGHFKSKTPLIKRFWYPFIYEKKLKCRGKFPLIQELYQKESFRDLLPPQLIPQTEINIGHIFIETGYTEPHSTYSGIYEIIKLRLKTPLALKNKDVISSCSIKINAEAEDGLPKTFKQRQDYSYYDTLFRKKIDLSSILPTKFFLKYIS